VELGLLADVASVAALAISLIALWRTFTIVRRLRERDQQTKLLLNFKRHENALRKQLVRIERAPTPEFLAALERCRADAETLSRLRYSKTRPDAIKLRARIRRFRFALRIARLLGADGWQRHLCVEVSLIVTHFTQTLENEQHRLQLESRYAGLK